MNLRNTKCRCGSGLKYKHCCWNSDKTLPYGATTQLEKKIREKEHKYFNKKYKEIIND
jgi:hypothetical protein